MKLALSPLDTWFFRDSTPFDRDASPQAGVAGVFPPHPPTVTGAIRAALALRNGWSGSGPWNGALQQALGARVEDLGALRFTGPFVLRGNAPVFPTPLHVVGHAPEGGAWQPVAMLRPGRSTLASDLGPASRLPEVAPGFPTVSGRLEPGARTWVTLDGLRQILTGALPDDDHLLPERELWTAEPRVGIERETGSRTTKDKALYSTRHARLRAGVGIGVSVEGVPEGWKTLVGSMLPLGGESRLASCEPWETAAPVDLGDGARSGSCPLTLVALTPVLLSSGALWGKDPLSASGARVVSACVGAPLRIGGWDSLARRPFPLRNALAPGSTLFCEAGESDPLRRQVERGTLRLGDHTAAGFGLCAVGNGPE